MERRAERLRKKGRVSVRAQQAGLGRESSAGRAYGADRSKNLLREVGCEACAGNEDRTGSRCDQCQRQRGSQVVLLAGGRKDRFAENLGDLRLWDELRTS